MNRIPIAGWPNYSATEDGTIYGAYGRPLAATINNNGYRRVVLIKGKKRKSESVHVLVCAAFHGPKPTPAHQVAHYDGIRSNCAASNLRWATAKENADDRDRHGTVARGIKQASAKLTPEIVREARARYSPRGRMGETFEALANRYGVSIVAMRKAIVGHNWGWVR